VLRAGLRMKSDKRQCRQAFASEMTFGNFLHTGKVCVCKVLRGGQLMKADR